MQCAWIPSSGITFAGVHDSYWTHAGTVDDMNRILREQFIELHNRPLLQNLLQDFRTNPKYVEAPRKQPRRKGKTQPPAVQPAAVQSAAVQPAVPSGSAGEAGAEDLAYEPALRPPNFHLGFLGAPPPAPPPDPPRPIDFPDVPPLGDLDINIVKDSTYFFA